VKNTKRKSNKTRTLSTYHPDASIPRIWPAADNRKAVLKNDDMIYTFAEIQPLEREMISLSTHTLSKAKMLRERYIIFCLDYRLYREDVLT